MASPNDGREIEGKNEPQKTLFERKKVGFMKLKEDVEELWKISHEQEDSFELEITQLKEKQEELTKSLDDKTAYASECDRKMKGMETELSCMKEKVAECEREHGGAGDVNALKTEMETLKRQIVAQRDFFRKANDAVLSISSYSEIQQKENKKLLRKHSSMKDELLAHRRISAETQQRQINEIDIIQCSGTAAASAAAASFR